MLNPIKKRRSQRSFQNKDVEEEKVEKILKAASFSPSAHGRYPWEIFVVRNKEKRKKLSGTSPWSGFVKDAPLVMVIVGEKEESSYWIEDCSVLAENIQLEAVNQGLGVCWAQARGIESPEGNKTEREIRNILKITGRKRVLCMIAIGYPKKDKKPHTEEDYKTEKITFIN